MLHGAVAGIAEIISCPGMINVDFADVRTVMSEMGMAMMGSAKAAGTDRARVAAEQAVACPLLEDINIADARGVLVNISASKVAVPAAGNVRRDGDDQGVRRGIGDRDHRHRLRREPRGRPARDDRGDGSGQDRSPRQQPKPLTVVAQKTGTDDDAGCEVDYDELDQPAVIRRRNRDATVEAMRQSGVEMLDIPAFLRKQAD